MRKQTSMTALCLSVLLGTMTASSQAVQYLHTIVMGSEGVGSVVAPDAADDLEDLERNVVNHLSLRPKTQLVYRSSDPRLGSLYKRLGSLYGAADSSDVIIGICQGAWVPNAKDPALSIMAGISPDTMTADYLIHLVRFLPVHNAVMFVLAPEQFEFPRGALADLPTGIGDGGKYLIVVRSKTQGRFEDLLDRFADLLDSDAADTENDANNDRRLSFTEWLTGLTRRAGVAGLSGSIHPLSRGADLYIKQLQ